jgi:hypothetical protein
VLQNLREKIGTKIRRICHIVVYLHMGLAEADQAVRSDSIDIVDV